MLPLKIQYKDVVWQKHKKTGSRGETEKGKSTAKTR